MEPALPLFFIAILPDATIQQEVTAFKQQALTRFGSGHALKSPPHVTLIPPFRSNQTDFAVLHQFAVQQPPFTLRLNGFNHFDQRVIYVDVLPNQPLNRCQQSVADFCSGHFGITPENRPFHPHMTVAFKDLRRSVFPEAWHYFSGLSYEREFQVKAITLLRHTGQQWVIQETFMLG